MATNVVLVISPDQGIRDMLELVLTTELGLRVIVADDIDRFVDIERPRAITGQPKPAAVLLDFPGSAARGQQPTSQEIVSLLRKSKTLHDVPLLAMSDSLEDGRAAKLAGCADYLIKPFDIDVLTSLVRRFVPRELEIAS